jgi:hypothetical protein
MGSIAGAVKGGAAAKKWTGLHPANRSSSSLGGFQEKLEGVIG